VMLKIKYGLWNSPDVRIGIRVNGSLVGSVIADQGYISPGPEYAMFSISNYISAGTDLIEAVASPGGGEAVIGYIGVGTRAGGLDLAGLNGISATAENFRILPAYPNPFNSQTRLSFDLPEAGEVSAIVFDAQGREMAQLADGFFSAGEHSFIFNGSNLPSGIYFVQLNAFSNSLTQKLLLVK